MGKRSYPIWNKVTNCSYQSDKSYGNNTEGKVEVLVGSSAKNSHVLVNHRVNKRIIFIDGVEYYSFAFFVDEVLLKQVLFESKDGKVGKFIKEISYISDVLVLK